MNALRLWSFWRVLVVSGGWILLCVLLIAAWFAVQLRGLTAASTSGSGGIGAVSVGINLFTLLIPFGPPIVLFVAWLIARWSQA